MESDTNRYEHICTIGECAFWFDHKRAEEYLIADTDLIMLKLKLHFPSMLDPAPYNSSFKTNITEYGISSFVNLCIMRSRLDWRPL